MSVLEVRGLKVSYGPVTAVHGVDFDARPGEITTLIGANGAGRSSILNAISGIARCEGSVSVDGTDLSRLRVEERAALVSHVPEGRRLFSDHTVRENLALAAYRADRQIRGERLAKTLALLPDLEQHMGRRSGDLSGGQQQMVALGRGLMSGAPILMIDELSLGLAPIIAGEFADSLRRLAETGLAVVLVEQYLHLALRISDRVSVVERGRIVLSGTAEQARDEVIALQNHYLGDADAGVRSS